jgi:hypothetical protein
LEFIYDSETVNRVFGFVCEEVWLICEEDVTCLEFIYDSETVDWVFVVVCEEVWLMFEEDVTCLEFIKCGVCLDFPKYR